jgi:hypothetical protein
MTVAYQVVYWRDIPAQVKLRAGRERLARPLSERFQQAIDAAAMRAGLAESDAYLAEWRSSDWQERDGPMADLAAALVAELESDYPDDRLTTLAARGGRES